LRSHDAPWCSTRASNYIRASAEARDGCELAEAGAEAEGIWVPTETLADFTVDARADPRFLDHLAQQNPIKFRQFLQTVVTLLRSGAQTSIFSKLLGFHFSAKFVYSP
jgi:hypothetical protein